MKESVGRLVPFFILLTLKFVIRQSILNALYFFVRRRRINDLCVYGDLIDFNVESILTHLVKK